MFVESFSITIGRIFDLINLIPIPNFPGAISNSPDNNDLSDKNIDTIALELPTSCFTENNFVGVWLGTRRLVHINETFHIPGFQVSRLGNPLVNELVIGIQDKNAYSHAHPTTDGQFATYVTNPTFPQIISNLFLTAVNDHYGYTLTNLAPNNFPRTDLVNTFLTGIANINEPSNGGTCDILRFNASYAAASASAQKNYGVIVGDNSGFPNGRRPGDDVIDIGLQVLMGALCNLNLFCNPSNAPVGNVAFYDGSPVSATDFLDVFPYLNTPYPGSGVSSSANYIKPFWVFW